MNRSPVYCPHDEAPARARTRPAPDVPAPPGVTLHHLQIVSRGDFVPGLLALPSAAVPDGGLPLLLVAHALSGSMRAEEVQAPLGWAANGVAVAVLDLPLHGARSSPKLSALLVEGWRTLASGGALDADRWALVEEFARQATSDWIRCLDALADQPEVDASRVGWLGLGLGALVGAWVLAHDVRIRSAAFAWTGASASLRELDPGRWLARTGDVEKLFVSAGDGDLFPAAGAAPLVDLATPPKRLVRFDGQAPRPGSRPELPGAALAEIRAFFRETLDG